MKMSVRLNLIKLQKFLKNWDITEGDWILGLNEALRYGGYNVGYKRKNHLHIIIDRTKIPWKIPKELKDFPDIMPPIGTTFCDAYLKFVKKNGFDFSILAFSKEKFKLLKNNSTMICLKKPDCVSILTPLGVLQLEGFVWNIFLLYSPEKLKRIMKFYYKLLKLAKKRKDNVIIKETSKLLKNFEKKIKVNDEPFIKKSGFISGQTSFRGEITGKAWVVKDRDKIPNKKTGDILVTTMTSEKFIPYFKYLRGIITDEGGKLCHAAIIARELKKPCIVGTKIATKILKNGDIIKLNANKGLAHKILNDSK